MHCSLVIRRVRKCVHTTTCHAWLINTSLYTAGYSPADIESCQILCVVQGVVARDDTVGSSKNNLFINLVLYVIQYILIIQV